MLSASAASLADILSGLFIVAGLGVTMTVGIVTFTTVSILRRIRRSAALQSATLHYRVMAETGPRREIAKLRLQLQKSVAGARITVGQADARAGFPGEAPAPFRRLQREAA